MYTAVNYIKLSDWCEIKMVKYSVLMFYILVIYRTNSTYTMVYSNALTMMDDEWHLNQKLNRKDLPEKFYELYDLMKNRTNTSIRNVKITRFYFNTFEKTNILKFNLNDHQQEETLDAELYVHVRQPDAQELNSDSLVLRLYQILPINTTNSVKTPDLHKLLHVVYLPTTYTGWQVFKVRETITTWKNISLNLGFLLTAMDVRDRLLRPGFIFDESKNSTHRSFLAVYLNQIGDVLEESLAASHKDGNLGCNRKLLHIDFTKLQGFDFIIKPLQFNAYSCSGSCSHVSKETFTNYGILSNAIFSKRMCCVPLDYSSMPIMFYDFNGNVVIKLYGDMIVKKCGCR